MENRHKRFKELRDHLRACRTALYSARSVTLFGDPINWVDTIRYLGVTLENDLPSRLTSNM